MRVLLLESVGVVVLLVGLVTHSQADDTVRLTNLSHLLSPMFQFVCCMGGWKAGVVIWKQKSLHYLHLSGSFRTLFCTLSKTTVCERPNSDQHCKEIHGTVLCSAPCCPGYEEKVERPPLLAPLVYCRSDIASSTPVSSSD